MSRRRFLTTAAAAGGALAFRWPHRSSGSPRAAAAPATAPPGPAGAVPTQATVALIQAGEHRDGVLRALHLLDPVQLRGKFVIVKPNLNSSHPFPGSTHEDTLRTLVEVCQAGGARDILIADRSGMGDTEAVIRTKGLDKMGREMGVRILGLETMPASGWTRRTIPGGHWQQGLLFPSVFEQADLIISTCCLKTHRFGGQFTLSLKNSVGMVARHGPDGHDYMREMHGSPLQRTLIAEINTLYRPALIVLDGLQAFVDGGPEAGKLARPGVVLAGTDRVAVDAVGVALLRIHGVGAPVSQGGIFEQEQIRRAVELGLGVGSPAAIELITDSAEGRAVVASVRAELARS
jgi:uncharacterized protein (DUF362 family)